MTSMGFIRTRNLSANQIPANNLTLNTVKKITFSLLVFLEIRVIINTPKTQKLPNKVDSSPCY